MGKTVALEAPAMAWCRERFRTYYGVAVLDAPPDLTHREFAAFPFSSETLMRRHASFDGEARFREYVRREVPRHVYYSSAYYEFPDHPKMTEKHWLGADLIFDLDADHLRDAAALSYPEQLRRVRTKVQELYDDFLLGDLGVDPGATQLVFSGGRGYHIHVRDERFRDLTSPERREIVEYILGTGIDAVRFVRDRRESSEGGAVELSDEPSGEAEGGRRRRAAGKAFKRLPPPDAPGWAGRIRRSVDRTLLKWEQEGEEVAAADLLKWDPALTKASAASLARRLVAKGAARQIREQGTLDVFKGEPPKEFLTAVLEQARVEIQGETDAPVTTDINRLIRLPGSLHGGTGFRVGRLTREELDAFDPFRSALPFVGPGRTTVRLQEAVDYPFAERLTAAAGETRELPDAVALFLVLRGDASLPTSPAP